ncbi:MAG: nicotinate-nucleotide--dimethylbenzimidazole phosphoribosyltransferase [Kurthia sp.]|nr:nicotinate-nucleotide--dimethylbenzimidazole phosphoribosyltransferase [Candidatus Kurthia equi]
MRTFEIKPVNETVKKKAKSYIDNLTKPIGSLGKLEQLAIDLAAVTGELQPKLQKPAILVFAADHGVTKQAVSAFPQEVTIQMVQNMANGGAAINAFARNIGASFHLVDVGVATEEEISGVMNRKVMLGTNDFSVEKAMTTQQAEQAILVGYEETMRVIEAGADTVIFGEVGIGNTTASSALFGAISNLPIAHIAGYGTGISDLQLLHKIEVIEQALELHQPSATDAMDLLEKIGGLEIAAMAGGMIAAAERHVPVLLDGLISTVAGCLADFLAPGVRQYLFASHRSVEPGHIYALHYLDLEPIIELEFRLGEGTGAAVAYPLFSAASAMMTDMATFSDAGVSGKN